MDKVKELLAVLDMSKGEQQIWWQEAYWKYEADLGSIRECSVPKAAFRLRDEMFQSAKGKAAWCQGCRIVIETVNNSDEFAVWSRPIHWIVAALIAKELLTEN